MATRSEKEHGPAPDYPLLGDEDIDRIVRMAIKYGRQPHFTNGDSWNKWMVTLCGGLALAGIVGGVLMFGKLSAIEANQINQQHQLDQMSSTVATLRRVP